MKKLEEFKLKFISREEFPNKFKMEKSNKLVPNNINPQ